MSYGMRLDEAINLAQTTRAKLAEHMKISVQAIGDVINGKTKAFTAENNSAAARFLRVDTDWLATGDGKPRPRASMQIGPEGIRDALRIQADLLAAVDGVDRNQVESALAYFITHPNEWRQTAEQIEAAAARALSPSETPKSPTKRINQRLRQHLGPPLQADFDDDKRHSGKRKGQ